MAIEILFWIGGSILFALGGLFGIKKIVKQVDVRGNADILIATVTIVGTLVSVVLGMLVSSAVDRYRSIEESVDSEASSIIEMFRLVRGLPEKPRSSMQSLCIEYCNLTINEEWPAMVKGQMSDDLTTLCAKLNDGIVGLQPADASQSNNQQALLTTFSQLGHGRRSRLVAAQSNWLRQMLPIIVMCSIVVLCISYLYVDAKPTKLHLVLVSFVATALGSNIGTMSLLSRPFAGEWSIKPDAFVRNVEIMQKFKNTPLFVAP